jgi:hypothetical protein
VRALQDPGCPAGRTGAWLHIEDQLRAAQDASHLLHGHLAGLVLVPPRRISM